MVSSTLDRSEKWWRLPDDSCRLSYVWLLSSKFQRPTGLSVLAPAILGVSLRCPLDEAERRMAAIEAAGMIETAADDVVRIVGWFAQPHTVYNPSNVTAFCKAFRDTSEIKRSDVRSRSILEFLAAALNKSEGWNPATAQYQQMMDDIQRLVMAEMQADKDRTIEAYNASRLREGNTVLDTVFAGCGHSGG